MTSTTFPTSLRGLLRRALRRPTPPPPALRLAPGTRVLVSTEATLLHELSESGSSRLAGHFGVVQVTDPDGVVLVRSDAGPHAYLRREHLSVVGP